MPETSRKTGLNQIIITMYLQENSQQIFMLYSQQQGITIFCRLEEIPECLTNFDDRDSVKISTFTDGKQGYAPKKMMNEGFKAAGIKFRLK